MQQTDLSYLITGSGQQNLFALLKNYIHNSLMNLGVLVNIIQLLHCELSRLLDVQVALQRSSKMFTSAYISKTFPIWKEDNKEINSLAWHKSVSP